MVTLASWMWSWRHAVCAGSAVLALAGAGCSDDTLTSPSSPAQLEGTWRLQQMTTSAGVHNEDLSANRFSATFSTNAVSLKADCNTCTGTTSLSGATLTVSGLACTLAACSTAPIDTRFSGFFQGPITVRINNRLLQLNAGSSEVRLEK